MSVVFLSPCLCEGNYGGVQLSGRVAREGLNRSGEAPRGVYYRGAGTGAVEHRGCTGSRVTAAAKAWLERPHADQILVWHVHLLKLLPFIKRRDSRTYLFLHGIECWKKMSGASDRLLQSVDIFLTNSAYTWSKFIEYNPRWKQSAHKVVPLGSGCPDAGRRPVTAGPAAIVIGRMEEREGYKGHRELIGAWPRVLQSDPRAELWIVGGGDLEPELRSLADSLGVAGAVTFHGRVTDEKKQELIGESRCLLLPSRGEGFGLVYLEAMRQGRPCLVSTLDAGREVVRPPEAGLAVDPKDIDAVGAAVVRLLQRGPEWDAWSERARALYESSFTAACFQDRLLSALRQ